MQNDRQSYNKGTRTVERAQPLLGQRASEIQPYGTVAHYPLALDAQVRSANVEVLNQILADTMVLREEQVALVDTPLVQAD
jgi:starvation-inducible DNA-binding protein